MRNSRGVLTVLVLVVVLSVSVPAYLLFPRPLPEPEQCDRDALLRWIVTRDLSRHSPRTRQTLARRLDEEFRTGIDWDAAGEQLSSAQRQQVWQNVLLLLEPWFIDRAERYWALPAAERLSYLDQILNSIEAWRGAESLRSTGGGETGRPAEKPNLLGLLHERIEACKSRVGPEKWKKIGQFHLALNARWVYRILWGHPAGPTETPP